MIFGDDAEGGEARIPVVEEVAINKGVGLPFYERARPRAAAGTDTAAEEFTDGRNSRREN